MSAWPRGTCSANSCFGFIRHDRSAATRREAPQPCDERCQVRAILSAGLELDKQGLKRCCHRADVGGFAHATTEKASGKIDGRHGRSRGHAQMSKCEPNRRRSRSRTPPDPAADGDVLPASSPTEHVPASYRAPRTIPNGRRAILIWWVSSGA